MFRKLTLFAVILTLSVVSSFPAKVEDGNGDIIKQLNTKLPGNSTGNSVNSIHSSSEIKVNVKRCTDCGNAGGHHTSNVGTGGGFTFLGRPAIAIA